MEKKENSPTIVDIEEHGEESKSMEGEDEKRRRHELNDNFYRQLSQSVPLHPTYVDSHENAHDAQIAGECYDIPSFPTQMDNIQDDPEPIVEHKYINLENTESLSRRNVFIRYLKPPTPPPAGPLIVQEVREPEFPPLPPLRVIENRESAHIDRQPPPLYFRECPPPKPSIIPAKVITKRLPPQYPPPLRQKIIERYPLKPPPRPRDIIIERWLPYPAPSKKRPIIYQRAPSQTSNETLYRTSKNKIINYHFSIPTTSSQRVFNLGIIRADPDSYYFQDCLPTQRLISQLEQIGINHKSAEMAPRLMYNSSSTNERERGAQWVSQDSFDSHIFQSDNQCPCCGKQHHFINTSQQPSSSNIGSTWNICCTPVPIEQRTQATPMGPSPGSDLRVRFQTAAAAAAAATHQANQHYRFQKRRSKSARRFF